MFRWLTGKEVVEVTASEANVRHTNLDLHDVATLFCKMEGGTTCLCEMDWLTPDKSPWHGDYRLRIIGSEGEAWISVGAGEFLLTTNSDGPHTVEHEDKALSLPEDFYCSIVGEESAITCDDGMKATQIVLAAKESARTGRAVVVG